MASYNRILALIAVSMLAYWSNPGMSQVPEKTTRFTDILPPINPEDSNSSKEPSDTMGNGNDSIAPSSVGSPVLEAGVVVYPNPASNRVMIDAGISDGMRLDIPLAVYAPSGKRVGELISNQWNDVSFLPAGIYYIRQEGQVNVRQKPYILHIYH